jgi:hypothetical protein
MPAGQAGKTRCASSLPSHPPPRRSG